MKISLLEYLDRTGRHVSRKTFEKYKDEKKRALPFGRYYSFLNFFDNIFSLVLLYSYCKEEKTNEKFYIKKSQ